MAIYLDGKVLAKKIREGLRTEVDDLKEKSIFPKLAVIMVGEDPASLVYVKNKNKACKEIGIAYEEHLLPEDIDMEALLELIDELNRNEQIHGILLQSPIPRGLDIRQAFEKIDPSKDVDGFHSTNVGKLWLDQDPFVSCTPYGVIKLLEEYQIEVQGKHAVIIGRSNIVGKPMASLLLSKNATVTICHSKTGKIEEHIKQADIIVAAVGKPKFITRDMVKEGAVVIDVGINRTEEGLVGDVDFTEVEQLASYITPVPGGVGPMTVAMLMCNVVKAAKEIEG